MNYRKAKWIASLIILLLFVALICKYLTFDPHKKEVYNKVVEFYELVQDKTSDSDVQKLMNMIHYEKSSKMKQEVREKSFTELKVESYKIKSIRKLNNYQNVYKINIFLKSSEDNGVIIIYSAYIDNNWFIIFGEHNLPEKLKK